MTLRLIEAINFLLQKSNVKVEYEIVRVEGLEPTRREALDPKSSVSTNFTTPAFNLPVNIIKF